MGQPDVTCAMVHEPANENHEDSNPTIVEMAPLSEGRRLLVAQTLARVLVARVIRDMEICANDYS